MQAVTGGRVRVAGRLLVPDARLTLRYGFPGQPPLETRTVALQRPSTSLRAGPRSSKATGLVEQLWAQQRLAALGVDPRRTTTISFGLGSLPIVTPGRPCSCSTIDQYIHTGQSRHSPERRPVIPAARPGSWAKPLVARQDGLSTMWENRVAWWSRELTMLAMSALGVESTDRGDRV